MKRINFVIAFFLICNFSFSQITDKHGVDIKNLMLSIPDSAINEDFFGFSEKDRIQILTWYEESKHETDEFYAHFNFEKLNNRLHSDSLNVDVFIDFEGRLIRIADPFNDPRSTYDIKNFIQESQDIIGITLKSSDHATVGTDAIFFYKLHKGKRIHYTRKVLNSFNYYTDNFSDSIINVLSHYYSRDLHTVRFNEVLLYSFTPSDTVYISNSFFDIPIGDLLDNDNHFNGEFYTKKYIMENGKLRLAE